jgi:hypothetical protein
VDRLSQVLLRIAAKTRDFHQGNFMELKSMPRRIAGAGAAVTAVGAMLIAPGVASAEAPYINIKHANSPHRCLDANADGDVYTHDCLGNDFQKWHNYSVDGWGKFRHKKT